jgi:hypothetical protein
MRKEDRITHVGDPVAQIRASFGEIFLSHRAISCTFHHAGGRTNKAYTQLQVDAYLYNLGGQNLLKSKNLIYFFNGSYQRNLCGEALDVRDMIDSTFE